MVGIEPCLHPIKMPIPNNEYDVLRPQGVVCNILLKGIRGVDDDNDVLLRKAANASTIDTPLRL